MQLIPRQKFAPKLEGSNAAQFQLHLSLRISAHVVYRVAMQLIPRLKFAPKLEGSVLFAFLTNFTKFDHQNFNVFRFGFQLELCRVAIQAQFQLHFSCFLRWCFTSQKIEIIKFAQNFAFSNAAQF